MEISEVAIAAIISIYLFYQARVLPSVNEILQSAVDKVPIYSSVIFGGQATAGT